MTDFAGVQDTPSDKPTTPYKDPLQWWYDMSQDEQDKYREESVAFIRNVGKVIGASAVVSNNGYITPDNPRGIDPWQWTEYKRLTDMPISEKPIEALQVDLTVAKDQVRVIEKAIAFVQG